MKNRYRVIISNKNLYREVELTPDMSKVRIGTAFGNDIRLHKDLFFEQIQLTLLNDDNTWTLLCDSNIYISFLDSRKLMSLKLNHGDIFSLKYQSSNSEIFTIEFLIDFDNSERLYERRIDLANISRCTIGANYSCQIRIASAYIKDDLIELVRQRNGYQLSILNSTYGVYHNSIRVKEKCLIENGDFFSISDFVFYYKNGYLWTEIRDDMACKNLTFHDFPINRYYPKFKRNTRIKLVLNKEKIEILDPPPKPQKQKNHIVTSLLPAMGMLLTSGMMAVMGGSMMIFSVISGMMAIITAVITVVQTKRDYKKDCKDRIETYKKYIENKKVEIEEQRKTEKSDLEKIYIDDSIELNHFYDFSSDLFDRQPEDSDFLDIRLGTGYVESLRKIDYKKQERLEIEDDLQLMPKDISEQYKYLENAPVVCKLKDSNAIGICGNEENRYALFKNILIDICARQYHADVELFFVADESHKERVSWLRFLPHVANKNNFRNIAYDDESKNRVFDYLYKELSQREKEKKYRHMIVFFYDDYGFQKHPISKFINNLKDFSVTFVFMSDTKSEIPPGCSKLIDLKSNDLGILIDTTDESKKNEFHYTTIDDQTAKNIVSLLAPVYTEEISLEGALTKNISLFELLNIMMVDDLDLNERWSNSQVYKSMAAPIGVTKNDVIYLDLHDKADGPHGLVAGTTGSGKSEVLQTYILSIATLFHPYEVSFLIIDFKGGGMVNQFKNLPHLLGAITNIDGKEINRSLKSIKAELQKRQRLFAEAEVNHIDKYIQKYKQNKVHTPIPHLIVIVDEFAELKDEQPDFMKELISAARIGRSLGVHLILATQKPAGQVNEQIWSNSRFKICLKVQSTEDSNEVLKSPLASEIKEPGRAYLQVGMNEKFELFQSAYSGAPEQISDINTKEFALYEVSDTGKRTPIYIQKKRKTSNSSRNQLDSIVDYVDNYCKAENIEKLPNICLPSLPKVIHYPDCIKSHYSEVSIGLYDDPDNQIQDEAFLDICNENTLIIGSSQYGKTNLLQSIIKSIVTQYSSKQASIYILDFNSMILKNFEELNHVGGVVCSSEDEKLRNLFKLLYGEISTRKDILLSLGLSSYASYIDAGYDEIPRIYFIIDNLTAFLELYEQDNDVLLNIIREGISVGINVIIANSQTSGIGYRYFSNFSNRIAFYCNDSNEYFNLFDNTKLKPDNTPGRCVIKKEKRILECQTYLAFKGEKEIDRVQNMKQFISKINEMNTDAHAKSIPYIPTILTNEMFNQNYDLTKQEYNVPIGLTYTDVEPFYINLSQLGIMGLCGKENKGHKNFISNLMNYLEKDYQNNPVNVAIFDDVNRKFELFKNSPIVDTYTLDTEKVSEILNDWYTILEERYNALLEEKETQNNSLLLMIVQNNDVAKKIGEDFDLSGKFNDMVSRFKGMNVAFIFTDFSNSFLPFDAPEPIRMIKSEQHIIFFDDLDTLKPFEVPYEEIRANKKRLETGDAYYIRDNVVTKIKMVKA